MHVEAVPKFSYADAQSAVKAAVTSSPAEPFVSSTPRLESEAATRPKQMHKCPEPGCGRLFNRKYTLVEHTKTHTGEKPHVCPVRSCRKRFSTSGNLSRHKRLHGVIQPLECPVEGCYCTFPSDNKLDKHMKFHLGSPVHVCTIGHCGKTFSTTGNLNRHVKHHHPNESLRPLPPPPPQMPFQMPLQPTPGQFPQQQQQQQYQFPVEVAYNYPSQSPVSSSIKRLNGVVSSFPPGVAQQYYGGNRWAESTRASQSQVMPAQLPSPTVTTPRGGRNLGIADVLSSIFDEMEYASVDPEKVQPAPQLQMQVQAPTPTPTPVSVGVPQNSVNPRNNNLLDEMVNFHVAHIEL